jgi:hypothetical protein
MLHAVYFYLVVNFGNLAALESIVWYVCSVTDATMGFMSSSEQELQGDSHYITLSSLSDTSK